MHDVAFQCLCRQSLDKFRDGENAGVKGCREWKSLDLHDTFDVIQHYLSR